MLYKKLKFVKILFSHKFPLGAFINALRGICIYNQKRNNANFQNKYYFCKAYDRIYFENYLLKFSLTKQKEAAVLIIHTYGTQCYSKENYIFNNSTLKSEDELINVLCAGEALKEYLEQKGVKVIHDKTLFDKISYSNAYNLSTEAVKKHIEKNPNIKYVIDIQRDSVFSQKGNCIKAVTNTSKGKTAQIGFISGCDENGADFPHWKENLSLSYALSEKLYQFYPKLSRGVTLLPSGYGQYSCKGFVTVEIGTAGNTPKEAKNAAEFLAEALYEVIY